MEPFVLTNTEGALPVYVIQKWQDSYPYISAGFTTRSGGVSSAPYDTFNVGLHVGDSTEDTVTNRTKLAHSLGLTADHCIYAEQVHGISVKAVSADDAGKGVRKREDALQDTDGIMTTDPNVVLCSMYADCVPLYFVDPVHRVIALSHGGWKGTVANIAKATVSQMVSTFGCDAKQILVTTGPSIGACCYEVDDYVSERVRSALKAEHIEESAAERILQSSSTPNKFMLNLQEMNKLLLEKAGILSSHIEVTQLCTSCRTDHFYSHRKERGQTGRMAAWMVIKKEQA
jgi:YfiH family protein